MTNFTDVDDKIITRAAKEGIEPLELSARYIDKYFEDAAKLGINKADIYPKASECIGDIIAMVQKIIDKGFGYVTSDGSVYFSIDKVENYGRLVKSKLEDMSSSGRVQMDGEKKNPMDFAIWKGPNPASAPGIPPGEREGPDGISNAPL